ncbi:peptidase C14 [Ramaria rubella]|nr:peptidase C14 [Ramaria rubella]
MYPANPRKKALCIGISYKGQQGPYGVAPEDFELSGAHNDVQKIVDLLTECYGYNHNDITVLKDAEGYKQPTKDNIETAMSVLMGEAEAGEHLFFFFAGHGDQITNLDGTEYDDKDEIILPLDWQIDETLHMDDRERYSQIIIDDDMNNILVKRLPAHCRLTALFDSCHSGTIMDLPYARYYGPRSKSPPKEGYIPMTTGARTISPEPRWSRRLPRETRVFRDNPENGSPQSLSEPQSPEDIAQINQLVSRGPLDLSYTLARIPTGSRGRTNPLWRKGTWILRGETLDDRALPCQYSEATQAISWSACSDGQSGYELKSPHENRSGGVMVQAFVEILRAEPYRTYEDILKSLGDKLRKACDKINKERLRKEWIMQEPQLGSQQKLDLKKLFAP